MTVEREEWEVWFEKWRGTELARLVIRLCEVLLRKGHVTADDARDVPLDGDPRIRGAAVRALVRLGIATKGDEVKSDSPICHNRPIRKFVVRDLARLEKILGTVCMAFGLTPPKVGQASQLPFGCGWAQISDRGPDPARAAPTSGNIYFCRANAAVSGGGAPYTGRDGSQED